MIGKSYPLGTEVQARNGYVRKKTGDGWTGRNRFAWQQVHGDLEKNQKVYHINGDKADDNVGNLVAIRFNMTKYTLKHSRVLWMPPVRVKSDQKGNQNDRSRIEKIQNSNENDAGRIRERVGVR